MDRLPSAKGRQERFQRMFLKKVAEEWRNKEEGREFPSISCKFEAAITPSDVASIPSARKGDVGLKLVYFCSRTGPILITTTGIFFVPQNGNDGYINWPDFDFAAAANLAYDDFSFKVESDPHLLAKNSSKEFPLMALGVTIVFGGWIAIFLSPFLYLIFRKIIRIGIKKYYFRLFPSRNNVLYLRLRHTRINVGPTRFMDDIITCIILALGIFRAQRAKYGR